MPQPFEAEFQPSGVRGAWVALSEIWYQPIAAEDPAQPGGELRRQVIRQPGRGLAPLPGTH